MHDRAVRLTGAVTSAVAIAIESTILLNIAVRITQVRPHVEKSVHAFLVSCRVRCPQRITISPFRGDSGHYSPSFSFAFLRGFCEEGD